MDVSTDVAARAARDARQGPSVAAVRRRRSDHPFYVGSAVFACVLSIVGFLPGIVQTPRRTAPMTPLVALHGLTMAAWLVLYLTQTILVTRGQVRLHRRLGAAGACLAAVIVVTGTITTFVAASRGFDLSGDLVRFDTANDFIALTILPFGDGLLFGLFVAAAILYRNRPAIHKRLMYFAIVGTLMGAPLSHIVGHFNPPAFVPALVFLLPLIASAVNDKVVHGRVHPVSWLARHRGGQSCTRANGSSVRTELGNSPAVHRAERLSCRSRTAGRAGLRRAASLQER
jgi:hypothetical protein